jgi:hypothetical protein
VPLRQRSPCLAATVSESYAQPGRAGSRGGGDSPCGHRGLSRVDPLAPDVPLRSPGGLRPVCPTLWLVPRRCVRPDPGGIERLAHPPAPTAPDSKSGRKVDNHAWIRSRPLRLTQWRTAEPSMHSLFASASNVPLGRPGQLPLSTQSRRMPRFQSFLRAIAKSVPEHLKRSAGPTSTALMRARRRWSGSPLQR